MRIALPVRWRLAVLALAVGAPFVALTVWGTFERWEQSRSQARAQALAAARAAAARLDVFAGNVESLLIALAAKAAREPPDVGANEELFARIKRELPDFVNNIKMNSPSGAYLGSSSLRRELSAAGRDYIARALAAQGTVAGEPVTSRATGEKTVALARRVADAAGEPVAVISVSIRLERLAGLLDPGALPSGTTLVVFDGNGTVLARNLDPGAWVGRGLGAHATVRRILGGREGVLEEAELDGRPRLAAYAAAQRLPWRVYVGLPREAAYAPLWRALGRDLAWSALVLAVAVVAGLLVGAPLVRGLRELAADAAELASGRLEHRPRVARGDEIGATARALEAMARALQARQSALAEREHYYRSLFHSSPLPMWVRDVAVDCYLDVNQAALAHYGYSREEFLALSSYDLIPPEDHAEWRRFLEARAGRGEQQRRGRHRRKDGSVIEVEVSSNEIRFEGRLARLALVNDVTARVQAERALRESEQRLQTITDHLPVLIAYLDREQRYRFLNRTYEDWFGEPRERYYGRTLREAVGEEFYEHIAPDIRAVLAGKIVARERFSRATAKRIYAQFTYLPDFAEDGSVRGFYVLGYDLTERRNAEERAAAERALLRAVIENLPDQIYVKDLAGRYLLLNPAAATVRGAASAEALIGKTAFDLYPTAVAARFDAEDRAVMDIGVPLLNRELEMTWPDGHTGVHLTTKVPLRDAEGRVIGLVGINRDVTTLRQSAEEIRRLNTELERRVAERTAQLEAANRELESFSYSVSHDLRAPLRAIEGFSRALLEDYGQRLDETARDYLRRLRAAAERMSRLIDDLLSLSRVARSAIRPKNVDLAALAREVLAELQQEEPERRVRTKIAEELPARGDPELLRLVLDNLLRNAWKFTRPTADPEIEIGRTGVEGRAAYFVRDNGVGFDMADAGRLFGAFQRLHSEAEFPGTGIGLATVRRAVRRHGGEVWVESAPGKGATFYFTLGGSGEGEGA